MSSLGSNARNGRWTLRKLGDLVEFRNGLNYDSSAQASAEGLKIIGVSNFMGRTVPDYESLERLAGFDNVDDRDLLRESDLVFVRSNGNKALIGRALFVTELGERVGHSGFTIRARVVTNILRPQFLASYAFSEEFRKQINRLGGGTNISNLSQAILACIRLPLPGLAEQDAIVEILNRADAAVRATDAVIEGKVAYQKALTEDLLTGRRRFPEFAESWVLRTFNEIFQVVDRRPNCANPEVLSCSKIYGIVPQTQLFVKRVASADTSNYKVVYPGDLVYDPMLLWDASLSFSDLEGVVSPAYETLAWRQDAPADSRYMRHLIKSQQLRHLYKTIARGTNVRRREAPVKDFLRLTVAMPDTKEQGKIAETLDLLVREIALLRQQRDILNEQKKGFMQKLLTGEVRLKEFRKG